MGADLPGFTPWVLRIEGLSACGLNAKPSAAAPAPVGAFTRSAFLPVTNPMGAPGGGACGRGSSACEESSDEELERCVSGLFC